VKFFSRWYVIAPVVGAVMTAALLVGALVFMFLGNALEACTSELGCAVFYILALVAAPGEFVFATLFSGIVARRLARSGAPSRAHLARSLLAAGVLAMFPAYLAGVAYLEWRY
jgi:hypothetical protein